MNVEALFQVRVIALGCAADLLKDNEAKKIAAENPDLIPTLLNALKVRSSPGPQTQATWDTAQCSA